MKISRYILIFGAVAIIFLPMAYYLGIWAYLTVLGIIAFIGGFAYFALYMYWYLILRKEKE